MPRVGAWVGCGSSLAVEPTLAKDQTGLLIFLIVVCIVFGGFLFVLFSGALTEDGERFSFARGVPRMKELPPGCLVTLIVAGAIWFILWGIVLLLALRLLNTPLD